MSMKPFFVIMHSRLKCQKRSHFKLTENLKYFVLSQVQKLKMWWQLLRYNDGNFDYLKKNAPYQSFLANWFPLQFITKSHKIMSQNVIMLENPFIFQELRIVERHNSYWFLTLKYKLFNDVKFQVIILCERPKC